MKYEDLLYLDCRLQLDFLIDQDINLIIRLHQLKVSSEETQVEDFPIYAREIFVDDSLPEFELHFEDYVSFHCDNESYAHFEKGFKGKSFRIYGQSILQEYVERHTDALPFLEYDNDFKRSDLIHYEIITSNSIISILTINPPRVKEVFNTAESE